MPLGAEPGAGPRGRGWGMGRLPWFSGPYGTWIKPWATAGFVVATPVLPVSSGATTAGASPSAARHSGQPIRAFTSPRSANPGCAGAGSCLLCPAASPSSRTVLAGPSPASWWPVEREPLPPNGNAMAVDPDWASLAITSDGVKIAPPTFLQDVLKRLRRLQRRLSRQVKGANNCARARLRRALAHATVGGPSVGPSPQARHGTHP